MKMMSSSLAVLACMAILAAPGLAPTVRAEGDFREMGRQVHDQLNGAVVTVKTVFTMSYAFGGQSANDQESRNECLGTVVSADGLTLVSLTEIDPGATMTKRRSQFMGPNDRFESKIKDLKLITADNTEIPAAVVLRDTDLDIAFIRPLEKPKAPMTFVDLSKAATPKLLENCVVVGRLGEIARRTSCAMTGEIQAIITKPRTFYIPEAEISSAGLATPVFNGQGAPIGFVMLRHNPSADPESNDPAAVPVVMPCSDIADVAKQAPEKAPEESAPAATPAAEGGGAPEGEKAAESAG